MEYVTLPGHLTFQTLQQLLLQRRLLQKIAEITHNQEHNHAIMNESQRADHAIIEIHMTCTANEDSWVYIHWEIDEEKREKTKEYFSQKVDTILLKPLSHCNLKLSQSFSSAKFTVTS